MAKQETQGLSCPGCGRSLSVGVKNCAHCDYDLTAEASEAAKDGSEQVTLWEREGERLKKLWIIAVVFFWFSASFQVGLFFIEGSLNFVLLSVVAGMLILGVVLKARYQLHLRKKPSSK